MHVCAHIIIIIIIIAPTQVPLQEDAPCEPQHMDRSLLIGGSGSGGVGGDGGGGGNMSNGVHRLSRHPSITLEGAGACLTAVTQGTQGTNGALLCSCCSCACAVYMG